MSSRGAVHHHIRAEVADRLRTHTTEIEQAIVGRIEALSQRPGNDDLAYVADVHKAVTNTLVFILEVIAQGLSDHPRLSSETAGHARLAARAGVQLGTLLRWYTTGSSVVEEFIAAKADGIHPEILREVLSDQGHLLDLIMEVASREYGQEHERMQRSPMEKRAHRVRMALERGGLSVPADVAYDFDLWHVCTIGDGPEQLSSRAAQAVAAELRMRLLSVGVDQDTTWLWFGSHNTPDLRQLAQSLEVHLPDGNSAALGEPGFGIDGWHRAFRDAKTAHQVAVHRAQAVTLCRDVILLSAVLRDQAISTTLVETFLTPLNGRGDIGVVLRKTLRAYFQSDQNVQTAAAVLGVARHTVLRRLRRVEECLGQRLDTCGSQIQVALGVEELARTSERG